MHATVGLSYAVLSDSKHLEKKKKDEVPSPGNGSVSTLPQAAVCRKQASKYG